VAEAWNVARGGGPAGGSGDGPGRPDREGRPVGRRVVFGVVGLGALGVLGGSVVQRFLADVAQHDPTGLTNLLPLGNQLRWLAAPIRHHTMTTSRTFSI